MDTSIFLAKLIGPVLMAVSIAMLLRPQNMSAIMQQTLSAEQGQAWIFFLGILAMLGGLAIIITHSVWDSTWRVIITLFGWGLFVKGTIRLFTPDWAFKTASMIVSNKMLMKGIIIFLLIIGFYLSYRGFIV